VDKKKYTPAEAEIIIRFTEDFMQSGYRTALGFLRSNTEPVLKPCPFCGSKAEYWSSKESGIIGCSNVRCHVPFAFSVEEWNTRV